VAAGRSAYATRKAERISSIVCLCGASRDGRDPLLLRGVLP
jgi:hypothetical protein